MGTTLAVTGVLSTAAVAVFLLSAAVLGVPYLIRSAVRSSLERCLEVQRRTLDALVADGTPPDVVVASSWGGAVAHLMIHRRMWAGPTVLLAPAMAKVASLVDSLDWFGRLWGNVGGGALS